MKVLFNHSNGIRPYSNIKSDFQNGKLPANPLAPVSVPSCEHSTPLFTPPLISFTGYESAPGDFELKYLYGINCPCCGKVMATARQAENFANKIEGKTGANLQNELSKSLRFLRPNEEEIANILIDLADTHPDLNLRELVELRAADSIKHLEETQMKIMDRMRKVASDLPESEKQKVDALLEATTEDINESNAQCTKFNRKDFVESMADLRDKYGSSNKKYDKLVELASKMPASYTNTDAFFVKYQRRHSREIAYRLMIQAIATTEHIKAKSKGGENNIDNYILMCGSCNSDRSNIPYNEWFKIHPEMPGNLQKYINQISDAIDNGEFKGFIKYETYCDEIIERIAKETGGKLLLSRPNSNVDTKPEDISIGSEDVVKDPSKTIRENREIWLEEINELVTMLSDYTETKNFLDNDDEFEKITEYVKESEILDEKLKMKNLSIGRLSLLSTRKMEIVKALKAAEKKNKTESEKQRYKNRLSKCYADIKDENIVLDAARSEYNKQKAIVDEIEDQIELPREITTQMQRLKDVMSAVAETHKRMRIIKARMASDEDQFIIDAGKISGEIHELEGRIETLMGEEGTPKREQESENAAKYIEYQAKLAYFVSVQKKPSWRIFCNKVSLNAPCNPDSIMVEAKDSLNRKIEEIRKTDGAKAVDLQEKINELKKEKRIISDKLEENEEYKAEYENAVDFLRTTRLKFGSDKEMEAMYKELAQRRQELAFKFKHVHVNETIDAIQRRIDKLSQACAQSYEDEQLEYEKYHLPRQKENPVARQGAAIGPVEFDESMKLMPFGLQYDPPKTYKTYEIRDEILDGLRVKRDELEKMHSDLMAERKKIKKELSHQIESSKRALELQEEFAKINAQKTVLYREFLAAKSAYNERLASIQNQE